MTGLEFTLGDDNRRCARCGEEGQLTDDEPDAICWGCYADGDGWVETGGEGEK